MDEEIKEQNPTEMNIDDLFKIGDEDPYTMTQKEFVEKTKSLLEKIYSGYLQGWQSRVLFDEEYPEESICDKCTGCGIFLENGEERDCVQDREWGRLFSQIL
jgi:hypothetical protein